MEVIRQICNNSDISTIPLAICSGVVFLLDTLLKLPWIVFLFGVLSAKLGIAWYRSCFIDVSRCGQSLVYLFLRKVFIFFHEHTFDHNGFCGNCLLVGFCYLLPNASFPLFCNLLIAKYDLLYYYFWCWHVSLVEASFLDESLTYTSL